MTKTDKTNVGMSMAERVAQWKKEHKTVFAYSVEDDNGETVEMYFKQPDRRVLSAATVTAKGDPIRYNEVVLKNSLLSTEHAEMLKDDSIFFGLSSKVDEIINMKVGELKKV